MMLLSAGFLVRSIGSANASTPEKVVATEKFSGGNTAQIGRFTCQYVYIPSYKDANGSQVSACYEYLIMDTETGQSVLYDYSLKNNAYSWGSYPAQMPVNTLAK